MPPRRPKDKGTDAERAVARFLAVNGFPHAERRASNGSADRGDITGTPGICWEVKSRKELPGDGTIMAWLDETARERQNAGARYGVLVVRRPGVSGLNANRWWAYLRMDDVVDERDPMRQSGAWPLIWDVPVRMLLGHAVWWLRANGYGDPPEAT